MRSYKLDDRMMDADFLAGKVIQGRAVIPTSEDKDVITEKEPVLVILSSGAKYKGEIKKFSFITIGNYIVGELEIVRTALK